MNLDATSLSTFQRCKRRHALEREYRANRWHPKTLLDTIMRAAILELSGGKDVIITSQDACTNLINECAHAGLDTLHDPYTLAKDYCAVIRTVLESLSRISLLAIKPGATLQVGETEHCWRLSAFQDESGLLHRWVLVDKWDDDAKYRELHSWYCFGDCAAAQVGMTLHVIEIGRQSKGHQHTDWARCYKHPAIHNKFRFRKVDGTPLEKSWIPVWFQNSELNDPKIWVDLMTEDRINLIHHITLKEPLKEHVKQFQGEVEYEAERMRELGEWPTVPMSRPACDMPYICPYQDVCYAPPGPVDVASIGGYTRVQAV